MHGGRRGWVSGSRILEGTVEGARAEVMKGIGILHFSYNRQVCANGRSVQAGRQILQHLVALSHLALQTPILSECTQRYILCYPDEVTQVRCLAHEDSPGHSKATATHGCRRTLIQILS